LLSSCSLILSAKGVRNQSDRARLFRKHICRTTFTLIFLAAPGDEDLARERKGPMVELTYNWDPENYTGGRNFGHLAYRVDDIYATCQKLMDGGVTINRPPRDGHMAFVRSPDGVSIELLQRGPAMPPKEQWSTMPNTGAW